MGAKYSLVDADTHFLETSHVLYNFIGLIINALDTKLIPPWRRVGELLSARGWDSDVDCQLHQLIQQVAQTDKYPGCVTNVIFPKHSRDVDTPKVSESAKIRSFCNVFNGATLRAVSVNDGKTGIAIVSTWDNLNVSKFTNCLNDLFLTGFYYRHEFKGIKSSNDPEQHESQQAGANEEATTTLQHQLVLVTKYPGILERLYELQDSGATKTFIGSSQECLEYLKESRAFRIDLYSANESYKKLIAAAFPNCKVVDKLQTFDKPPTDGSPLRQVTLKPKTDILSHSGYVGGFIKLKSPIQLQGTVIKGFGRGSSFLGIPTANLDCGDIPHLIPGVYYGIAQFFGNSEIGPEIYVDAIVSIGFNPHFDNTTLSVEPYLYWNFKESLLGQDCKLTINGFIRCEGRFTSVDSLIDVIDSDLFLHSLIIQYGDN